MPTLLENVQVALGDRYAIERELGQGGMAVVYLARDVKHDRPVGVKVLRPEVAQALGRERFLREIKLAAGLAHPHILPVHDSGETDGLLYYVMPYLEGESLRGRLEREGRLTLDAATGITSEVADALAYAHRHDLVHRDIKPENILFEAGHAMVTDFGIARPTGPGADGLTGTGIAVGTPAYMSPEQALGEPVGPATDVFSLGVVLFEIATGRHPYAADTPAGVVHAILTRTPIPPARVSPDIPAYVDALVLRMLDRDPDRRPGAPEVVAALRQPMSGGLAVRGIEVPVARQRHTVGREKERAALRAGFESATAECGLILCVTGEPGIGKTTLVEEFLAELSAGTGPCRIGRGRCSERLAGSEAYLPFVEALESLLRADASGSLAGLLRATAPGWHAELVPPEGGPPVQSAAISQERLKREVAAFLHEVSRTEPLVLFFDDVHWADVSTMDLLSYLAGRFASLRALVVASYRPTDLLLTNHPFLRVKLELQGRGLCREIPLDFLVRDEVERYVGLEFPGHRFPETFASLIHAKTEGSPLFMVDVLRYLRNRDVIVRRTEGWELGQAMPDLERDLPESVRGMIQRKIDLLGDAERALLVAASVQGHEFDSATVAKALARDAAEVEERLQVLDRVHAFVRVVGEATFPDGTPTLRYHFVHVLYQNLLYASVAPTRRASLAAAVADALLGCYREQSGAVATELAFLFEAARDARRAADYFLVAARNAARVSAYREAMALVRRGVALVEGLPPGADRGARELELHITLGGLAIVTQGSGDPEVEAVFTRARDLAREARQPLQLFTALRGLSEFYHTSAQLETGLEWAEQALAVAERVDDPALVVDAHHAVAMPLLYLGRLVRAREHLERGIALHDPTQRRVYGEVYQAIDPGVGCRFQAARVWWLLGFPDRALGHAEAGITLARRISHHYSLSNIYVSAAMLHQCRREPARARERAEAAMAVAREFELPEVLVWATIWRGWAIAVEGRLEEGMRDMRAAMAAHGTHRAIHPHRLALLAEVLGRAGAVDEALDVLAEAMAEAERGGRYYQAELHRLRGELLLLRRGDAAADEAAACFRRAIEISQQQAARSLELRALLSLTRLCGRLGKAAEVVPALAELYTWFTEGFDTADLREAKALLGT